MGALSLTRTYAHALTLTFAHTLTKQSTLTHTLIHSSTHPSRHTNKHTIVFTYLLQMFAIKTVALFSRFQYMLRYIQLRLATQEIANTHSFHTRSCRSCSWPSWWETAKANWLTILAKLGKHPMSVYVLTNSGFEHSFFFFLCHYSLSLSLSHPVHLSLSFSTFF